MKRVGVYIVSVVVFILITFGAAGLGLPTIVREWVGDRFGVVHPVIDEELVSYADDLNNAGIEVIWMTANVTQNVKYGSIGLPVLTQDQAEIVEEVLNKIGNEQEMQAIAIWLWTGRPENKWVTLLCMPSGCQPAPFTGLNDESWNQLIVEPGWAR